MRARMLLAGALLSASCSNGNAPADGGLDAHLDATEDTGPDVPPVDVTAPTCTYDGGAEPTLPVPALHTPRWAFEPWISKDISTTDDTYTFVDGFRSRNIPIGVVVLDSPWETQYNTFVPNPVRYHDFAQLVNDMHGRGVRVVLWTTQMVNHNSFDAEMGGDTYVGPSPNFDEGRTCGFFIDGAATYAWWKGLGAGLDFFNPTARGWWHAQQNTVLDMGIDGWKLDFGDAYITADPVQTAAGPQPRQTYGEAYYSDFYAYGVGRRGSDFVTMPRAYDKSYQFPGHFYARPETAPVAWVGDDVRDWGGFGHALDEMLRSAQGNYVVVGSDIGGYLAVSDQNVLGPMIPFDTLVFARWTAVGAMTPLMQLHGQANITPWTVPDHVDETVALYQYWATLHHELVPMLYSFAEESHAAGMPYVSLMQPLGDTTTWAGDDRYVLANAFLVAPMVTADNTRDVALPAGSHWYDWWDLTLDAYPGGQTLTAYDATDRARMPLFVKEGAIVPLNVAESLTGLGTAGSAGATTLALWPGQVANAVTVHDADGATTRVSVGPTPTQVTVTLSRRVTPVILRVRIDASLTGITVDGTPLASVADHASLDAAAQGWFYDTASRLVWVKLPTGTAASTIVLAGH